MPMKDWLYRIQPIQLYVVLTLSICYFLVQLYLSHITHALTLLMNAYHMLCNIIALSGCILTIKHSKISSNYENSEENLCKPISKEESRFVEIAIEKQRNERNRHEMKLRNTFGWTRIDVLTMLVVYIFLATLSFSLLVEALQTLIHIDHQDTMHHPVPVFVLGTAGLVLNGLCYLLIGGYTLHQGSFLHITSSGDVILDSVVSTDNLRLGERRLSKTKRDQQQQQQQQQNNNNSSMECRRKGQSLMETFRDISSTIFVMICAVTVYFRDDDYSSRFIDPVISICSCILLLALSYPYMKESSLILLQTIPGSIDIEMFKSTLLSKFTDIVSVHDLHIWQLTSSRSVSTVHIIFQDPIVYCRIMNDVKNFFHEQGITIVTIQPEFKITKLQVTDDCLVKCKNKACIEKHCCRQIQNGNQLNEILHKHHHHDHTKTKINGNKMKENHFNIINNLTKSKSIENLKTIDSSAKLKSFSSYSELSKDLNNVSIPVIKTEQNLITKTDNIDNNKNIPEDVVSK